MCCDFTTLKTKQTEIAQWNFSGKRNLLHETSASRKTYTNYCHCVHSQLIESTRKRRNENWVWIQAKNYALVKCSQFLVLHTLRLLLFYDVTKLILCLHSSHPRALEGIKMKLLTVARNSVWDGSLERLDSIIDRRARGEAWTCTSTSRQKSNEHKKYRICIVYMMMRLRRHLSAQKVESAQQQHTQKKKLRKERINKTRVEPEWSSD